MKPASRPLKTLTKGLVSRVVNNWAILVKTHHVSDDISVHFRTFFFHLKTVDCLLPNNNINICNFFSLLSYPLKPKVGDAKVCVTNFIKLLSLSTEHILSARALQKIITLNRNSNQNFQNDIFGSYVEHKFYRILPKKSHSIIDLALLKDPLINIIESTEFEAPS